MRFFAAVIFILNIPVIIFIASIQYGGISQNTIKKSLLDSGIYTTMLEKLEFEYDADSQELASFIKERATPLYLQNKTETLISDTASWINNASDTPPVLSFADIKEDLKDQNPELLVSFEQMQKEVARESSEGINPEQNPFSEFSKNNFTIPIGTHIQFVKDGYNTLKILFPLLIVMNIFCLAALLYFSHTVKQRFLWVGITLLISALVGFLHAATTSVIATSIPQILRSGNKEIGAIASQLALSTLTPFTNQLSHFMITASTTFLLIAIVLIILAFFRKPLTNTLPVKKQAVKNSGKK